MSWRIVTPDFVEGVIRSGPLTEARHRIRADSGRSRDTSRLGKLSSWSLVCEEMLDTEHAPDWYDDIVAELRRRGFSDEQVDAMRRFAWQTAGWLNYDKMWWEWVSLDEKDIRAALDWQLRDGLVTREQYDDGLAFIEHPQGAPRSPPR